MCEKVDESLSIALEAFHVWSVEDWFAVPFRATLTPAENNCISNMFMYWPVVDSTFIFLAFTEHVTVEGAAVTGDVVGEGLDMEVGELEVGAELTLGSALGISDGEVDGFNVSEHECGKSNVNSDTPHVSPVESLKTTAPCSSSTDNVAFDNQQRHPFGSVLSTHHRLNTLIALAVTGVPKLISHQPLGSVAAVDESVVGLPSIAFEATACLLVDD